MRPTRPGGEGAQQQADAGRFCRRHHVAHQSRRPGHGRVGTPAHGRPGQHHRGGRDRLPGGIFVHSRTSGSTELGISKVMTITSTYDHRIIQGAESGAFLGIVDRLLQGEEGFYDLIAESLELSPRSATRLAAPRLLPERGFDRAGATRDAVPRGRRHGAGQGVSDARSPGRPARSSGHRPHRRPRARSGDARPDARGHGGHPVEGAPDGRTGQTPGRIAALPPGDLLRNHGVRDRAHLDP